MDLLYNNKFQRKDGKVFWITIFNEYGTVNIHIYGTDPEGNQLKGKVLRNYVIDFDNLGAALNDAESAARELNTD